MLIESEGVIFACSSSIRENSAIAIIRVSGFDTINDFQTIFSKNLLSISPNQVYVTNLLNNEKIIDQVCLVFFKGPNSFTGENLIEIHCHGNPIIVDQIFDILKNLNFKAAKAGEFSFRALKNKKLSLSQIESLDLILNSQSKKLLDIGQRYLNGELDEIYSNLRDRFINLKSSLEIQFDFLEDVGEEAANLNLNKEIEKFSEIVKSLVKRTTFSEKSLTTPKIVLFGPPNAGKSTLFNMLLGHDRSIVSNIEGTTRDYVTENIKFNNTTFSLIDTAGLRESSEEVEKAGITNSLKLLKESQFKLLVLDIDNLKDVEDFLKFEPDFIVYTHYKNQKEIKFINNYNALAVNLVGPIGPLNKTGSIEPQLIGPIGPKSYGPIGPVLNTVEIELLNKIYLKYSGELKDNIIPFHRHKDVILAIYDSFKGFKQTISSTNDIALAAARLNDVESLILELIGLVSPEDVLNNIFENFCIGK